jgi:hypothetical protein
MKQEHYHLSREAYQCSTSIPELNKMVFAVQALGKFALVLNVIAFELHVFKNSI